MVEVDFPNKLIRLTKVTLTTIKCCVKIQDDRLYHFEMRQRLRQGDVLSTLVLNVLLEAIIRRTKLQTTDTILNKQTQLSTYADDVDIIGRSLEAVAIII
jgi:hypothetical protein